MGRDDFRNASEGGEKEHINFRVAEEPEEVLEEEW